MAEANGAARDERRIIEETLAEAVTTAGFGTFDIDLRSRCIRLSSGTEESLGYPSGTIANLSQFIRLIHPEDVGHVRKLVTTAEAARLAKIDIVYRLQMRGGEYRIMRGVARCLYGDDGCIARLFGRNTDLTGLSQGRVATRRSQLRALLNAVPDAMLIVDKSGTIESFNRSAEQAFGYSAEQAMGQNLSMLAPREVLGADELAFGRFVRSGNRGQPAPPLIMRGRHADGREIPIEVRVETVSAGDEPLYAVSMRDISERLAAEERLRTLNDELAHAMRVNAMGEMAADIAHELNQPLAALSNYLEAARLLLGRETLSDPRPVEMIESAVKQAIRAGTIIRRIRKFVTRGEVDIRIEPVEETVRDAVNLVFVGRAQYDVRVNLAFDRQATFMMADRVQVQQVIVNLMRNAIDALQQVGPDNRNILVKAGKAGDMVEISVIDTGPGISEDVVDRLYQPFRSTKGGGGMGVGLTISRRIVEAHGGRIWAENRPEGGACFRFTVPALEEQDGDPDP